PVAAAARSVSLSRADRAGGGHGAWHPHPHRRRRRLDRRRRVRVSHRTPRTSPTRRAGPRPRPARPAPPPYGTPAALLPLSPPEPLLPQGGGRRSGGACAARPAEPGLRRPAAPGSAVSAVGGLPDRPMPEDPSRPRRGPARRDLPRARRLFGVRRR